MLYSSILIVRRIKHNVLYEVSPLFSTLAYNVPLCLCVTSKVPAFLNVVDIAGLVKGAHEGQGLGNAFLSHIRACDALFHMSSRFNIFIIWVG